LKKIENTKLCIILLAIKLSTFGSQSFYKLVSEPALQSAGRLAISNFTKKYDKSASKFDEISFSGEKIACLLE